MALDKITKKNKLHKKIEELQINYCLLSSCNIKWNLSNLNQIEQQLKQINKNIEITSSDSRQYKAVKDN